MRFWLIQYTILDCTMGKFRAQCVRQGCTNRCSLAAGLQGNGERMRKWRGNGERMRKLRGNGEKLTLYIPQFSLHFLPLSPFPLSLSISYIKIGHIMLQNVKYGTFVANVSQILTYELWGNNSGSNLLPGSSASCAGLDFHGTHTFGLIWWFSFDKEAFVCSKYQHAVHICVFGYLIREVLKNIFSRSGWP